MERAMKGSAGGESAGGETAAAGTASGERAGGENAGGEGAGGETAAAGRKRRPDALRLERRQDGQLWAVLGSKEEPVRVRRLFPWSEEGPWLSLRDGENRELAALGPDADLDAASAQVLAEAAKAASFVLEITRVLSVEDEIEIRVWRVETRRGPRVFQTRLDDWPTEVPGGRFLIRDVAGDVYLVSDPGSLDRRSREILWAFVG